MFNSTQKAYLAGFLDGDGSIYVRLKKNDTYRYGYQISPYIVLFQSAKSRAKFEQLCKMIGLGSMRTRKDGIMEYTIGKNESLIQFLKMVKPHVILKRNQVELMLNILEIKKRVRSKNDFEKLVFEINKFRDLNYSKVVKKII